MIFWIIVAIVLVATIVTVVRMRRFEPGFGQALVNVIFGLIMYGFIGALAFAVLSFTLVIHMNTEPLRTEKMNPITLSAMSNSTEVRGGIFVIQSNDVIRYVTQEPDGAYVVGDRDTYNSKVYEDATSPDSAVLVERVKIFEGSWFAPWIEEYESFDRIYEFHVPKGTVVQEFVLDVGQ